MKRKTKYLFVLFVLFGIAGCDDSSKSPSDTEKSPSETEKSPSETDSKSVGDSETDSEMTDSTDPFIPDQYESLSDPLFAIDNVMEVKVEMNPDDWDLLRYESPNMDHFTEDDCPSGPRPTPFNWYKASVTLNGDSLGEIEVRKKGLLGSMDPMRPSLKLNFKKDDMPGGIERMTLNNKEWETSFSRECLSYYLFRKAGIAAPRCGLAKVTVNGRDLGIYTHIEEIKPPMLSLHYGADAADGDLYELTTADFTDELEVVFEPKGDDTDHYDAAALHGITEALKSDDDKLFEELGKYLDVDKFFIYWAMEILTVHWDGYAGQRNNSFLYRNPKTGLFEFIPWGTDGDWNEPEDFFGRYSGAYETMPWSLYAHGAICRRLIDHPLGKSRYKETLLAMLDTVWNEDELLDILNTVQSTVEPYLTGNTVDANINETGYVKSLIQSHKQDILDEIEANPNWPSWDRPVNPPHCASVAHTFSGTLTTSYESLDADIISTGSGEASDDDGSKVTDLSIVRGLVGTWQDPANDEMTAVEIALGPVSDVGFIVIYTYFPSELFYEGNTVLLNYGEAQTDVMIADVATGDTTNFGFVATGKLTVDALDPTQGGEVQISFEAPVGRFQF